MIWYLQKKLTTFAIYNRKTNVYQRSNEQK